jgi:hypothetical protein
MEKIETFVDFPLYGEEIDLFRFPFFVEVTSIQSGVRSDSPFHLLQLEVWTSLNFGLARTTLGRRYIRTSFLPYISTLAIYLHASIRPPSGLL